MSAPAVLRLAQVERGRIPSLLGRYGLVSVEIPAGERIPGSYWGEPEAGLIGPRLHWRPDTPVHSLLHELAHFVCMSSDRRAALDTDAGGSDLEECAVCYLEILLADQLAPFDSARCLSDMDSWGYSFREGSARAWLDGDGREAREWLAGFGLIRRDGSPSWRLRS